MNENQTLREQMWDLCYGLLSAEEVAALHKQIKSDPAAARLYAEVRLQADLVASAAKVEDASVTLSVPDEGRKVQPAAKSHSGAGESPFKPAKSGRSGKKLPIRSYRAANWLAGLAAMVLVGLIGYGFLSPARPGSSPTDDMVVATVYGPDSLQSGLTQNLKVVAKNRRGEPASTPVSYFVYSADRKLALDGVVQTDEAGEAQLSLSGSLIQPGAVLEVQPTSERDSLAWNEKFAEHGHDRSDLVADSPKVVVPLAAKEEPVTSDVQFERHSYQPGETFRFWVHSWRAFSNEPAVPADDWKLVMDNGRELQPSAVDARPEAGIVSGEFQLPADAPVGHYRFVGVNRQSGQSVNLDQVAVGVDADESGVNAHRAGMASYDRHRLMPRGVDALAKAELDKAPEPHDLKSKMAKQKTELAAGGSPRVASAPKTASPTLSAPAKAHGGAAGTGPVPPAAAVVAAASPRGEDETKQIAPSAKADRAGGKGVVAEASGDSLVVTVPAKLADRKLLAVVTKYNVQVATQQYKGLERSEERSKHLKYAESHSAKNGPAPAPSAEPAPALAEAKESTAARQLAEGELKLHLPPEADGELLVTLYDQSVQPSTPVYRQLVRRPSSREMKLEVTQESAANFTITATDHNGQAIPRYFLAARMVRADAVEFEKVADAPAGRYASGDKAAADGSRGGAFGPAGAGFGGGSGKGVAEKKGAEKLPDLKDGKEEADKKKKDVLDKQDQDKELRLQMARGGIAPSGAAKPAPSSAAGGEASEGIEALSKRTSSNGVNQLFAEDMTARDYASEPVAEQAALPQEVLLASNDSLIQDAVRAEEVATQAARADFQKMVGRLVLVVAAAALLLFGLLAIVHRPAQAKVWVPAMAVVAGSFAVGSFWLMSGNLAGPTAGTVALAPDRSAPTEYFKEDAKPMAPATRSLPSPVIDDVRTEEQLREGTDSGEMRPAAAAPGGGPVDRAKKVPASFGSPPRGGGLESGKSAAAVPPQKSESAEKPSELSARPNELAPSAPAPRAENSQKQAEERKKEEPSRESAKDAAQPKKSGTAQTLEKSAAIKSKSESVRDKRAKTPSLLWQPNLQANEKGEAELNIQLPTEAGDYYLLVDVQAPNGVGTIQRRIPVHVPAAVPAAPAAPASPAKP